jgi:hypothetical protein
MLGTASFYYEGQTEEEDNDSSAQANGRLRSGVVYQGYPDDDRDYFYFDSASGDQIEASLSGHTGTGVQFVLYYLTMDDPVAVDSTSPFEIEYTGSPGRYYILIYTAGGHNDDTEYTLQIAYP